MWHGWLHKWTRIRKEGANPSPRTSALLGNPWRKPGISINVSSNTLGGFSNAIYLWCFLLRTGLSWFRWQRTLDWVYVALCPVIRTSFEVILDVLNPLPRTSPPPCSPLPHPPKCLSYALLLPISASPSIISSLIALHLPGCYSRFHLIFYSIRRSISPDSMWTTKRKNGTEFWTCIRRR